MNFSFHVLYFSVLKFPNYLYFLLLSWERLFSINFKCVQFYLIKHVYNSCFKVPIWWFQHLGHIGVGIYWLSFPLSTGNIFLLLYILSHFLIAVWPFWLLHFFGIGLCYNPKKNVDFSLFWQGINLIASDQRFWLAFCGFQS